MAPRSLLGVLAAALSVLSGAVLSPAASSSPRATEARLTLSSPAFRARAAIPARYTCEGANVSPPLRWSSPPARTRFFALILDDPDAPSGTFTHWVVWGIPGKARALREAKTPPLEGTTSFGSVGYGGPCPPPGDGPHRYVFTLYALDAKPALARGASKRQLLRAIGGHVLAKASLVGTYER